jgi:hypothetical protein
MNEKKPDVHVIDPKPTAETAAEQIAKEIVELPRAFARELFGRLESIAPGRGKIVAREAGKQVDETILEFMTQERRIIPRYAPKEPKK